MTLEKLLSKIKIDSDTGFYFEGKFRCSIAELMSSDIFYNAYAHLEVDSIAIDDVYTDKLKITLKSVWHLKYRFTLNSKRPQGRPTVSPLLTRVGKK